MDKIKLLNIISEKTRFRIICLLREEKICVCELQELLDITQVAASKHLKRLKEFEVVTAQKIGNRIFYTLNDDLYWIFDVINIMIQEDNQLKEEQRLLKNHLAIRDDKTYSCPSGDQQ